MLPTASVRKPAARRIAVIKNVVVVLPSVPVTATVGRGPSLRVRSMR